MDFTGFQTVGLLRFSVLTTDFLTTKLVSFENIRENIFRPDRLELRFRLFEALCLPSLIRQTDSDFRFIILTSAEMPAPYLDRLRDLAAPHPNIMVNAAPVEGHYQLIKAAYAQVAPDGASHRLSFRLDDDDALDLDYIARLKRMGAGLIPVTGADRPTAISFNRGFYVELREGEDNPLIDSVERAPLSVGTALMHPNDQPLNPYRFNHRAFAQHYNSWSDISVPGFLRTIHSDNVSAPAKQGITGKMRPRLIEKQIKRHFGVDPAMLKAL